MLLSILLIATRSVPAHEYWLDPVGTQWRVGDRIQADIRNGQDFLGSTFPFDPDALARAGLISATKRLPLTGRLGDYPAFQMPAQESGLNLLLLETTRRELIYADMAAFEEFLDYHALSDVRQHHRQRDLPQTDIIEHYYRYCKALLEVNSGIGIDADTTTDTTTDTTADTTAKSTTNSTADTVADPVRSGASAQTTAPVESIPALQPQGQRLELIASENPLGSETLRIRVLFEDTPLAGRQIELFHRDESANVTRTTERSDDEGYVQFNVAAMGDYLFNTVWIEEPADPTAHWMTSWASLFFQQTDKLHD